jgi:hypothetical protein
LNEIVFSSDSHLKNISGFGECTSLCRIEIPSSVEAIWDKGFSGCISLNEIVFSSDSRLRILCGFHECTSLCRIENPSSVERLTCSSFPGCASSMTLFCHPTVISERFLGFKNAHQLVELRVLHQLRKSSMLAFLDARHRMQLFFH